MKGWGSELTHNKCSPTEIPLGKGMPVIGAGILAIVIAIGSLVRHCEPFGSEEYVSQGGSGEAISVSAA